MYASLSSTAGTPVVITTSDDTGIALVAGSIYIALSWDEARMTAEAITDILTREGVTQP